MSFPIIGDRFTLRLSPTDRDHFATAARRLQAVSETPFIDRSTVFKELLRQAAEGSGPFGGALTTEKHHA